MAEMLLAQLCKVCTEIRSLFTQPHCRTEIKHKTMPRHLGQFFLWKEASHKWPLCLSLQLRRCRLTLAIDGQSSGQWKKWALTLATLGCSFGSSLPRLPSHTHAALLSSLSPLWVLSSSGLSSCCALAFICEVQYFFLTGRPNCWVFFRFWGEKTILMQLMSSVLWFWAIMQTKIRKASKRTPQKLYLFSTMWIISFGIALCCEEANFA